MFFRVVNRVSLLVLFWCLAPVLLFPADSRRPLRVTAVQWEISPELYRSPEAFFHSVEEAVRQAVAENRPDLIVFPEYIGVFYQLMPLQAADSRSGAELKAAAADFLSARGAAVSDWDWGLLLRELQGVTESYRQGWSRLAKRYNTVLVAGTRLHPTGAGPANRVEVWGGGGELLYRQDKIFLTPFEGEWGFAPGKRGEIASFTIRDHRIVLTICRDAYYRFWEKIHAGADLWLDLKANGALYDQEQQASFLRALPARLAPAGVPRGLTVCAVGSWGPFFWEGRSFVTVLQDGVPVIAEQVTSSKGFSLLHMGGGRLLFSQKKGILSN